MAELFANTNASIATLTVNLNATAKALTVTSTAKMPAALLVVGEFRIVIGSEIMMITSIGSGTNWTIGSRGIENTIPAVHTTAETIFHKFTAGAATQIATTASAALTTSGATIVAQEVAERIRTMPNLQKANYTFALSDQGKTVEYESATVDGIFTIPKGVFEVGTQLWLTQVGAHKAEIVGATGVEVKTPGGLKPKTDAQWSTITMRRRAGVGPEQWVLAGDLEV